MNPFPQLLSLILTGIMVLGSFSVTNAGSISRGNSLGETGTGQVDSTGNRSSLRSNYLGGISPKRCLDILPQRSEIYDAHFNSSNPLECGSHSTSEMTWIYSPGCPNWGLSENKMGTGSCVEGENIMGNIGVFVANSSDEDFSHRDTLASRPGLPDSNKPSLLTENKKGNSENSLESSMRINDSMMPQPLRFDRMSKELFDGEEINGTRLAVDFDHQLVITGKLAHLVPKVGQFARALEFGDLIILFFFALLPEEKRIRRLFGGVHYFKMIRGFNS